MAFHSSLCLYTEIHISSPLPISGSVQIPVPQCFGHEYGQCQLPTVNICFQYTFPLSKNLRVGRVLSLLLPPCDLKENCVWDVRIFFIIVTVSTFWNLSTIAKQEQNKFCYLVLLAFVEEKKGMQALISVKIKEWHSLWLGFKSSLHFGGTRLKENYFC